MSGDLSHEAIARAALNSACFRAQHKLGQNFLLREDFLSQLLDGVPLPEGCRVLEIGPGAGVMTALLADRGAQVTAVEVDRHLEHVLGRVLEGRSRVNVLYQDARKLDLDALMGNDPFIVIANLPYYITTEILEKLTSAENAPEAICIMVQEEAAGRILAAPGEKQWCHLAAQVSLYGCGHIVCRVPRSLFEPAPNVDSVFLSIKKHECPPVKPKDMKLYRRVLAAAFYMRRKTLLNNLKAVFSLSREQAQRVLEAAGLSQDVRGEALSLQLLAQVSDALSDRL